MTKLENLVLILNKTFGLKKLSFTQNSPGRNQTPKHLLCLLFYFFYFLFFIFLFFLFYLFAFECLGIQFFTSLKCDLQDTIAVI